MTSGLKRYQEAHHYHFITFSCSEREPLLHSPERRDLFLEILERVRRRYRMLVYGYVVMPEHVHLLVGEPEVGGFSRDLRPGLGSGFLSLQDS